MFPLPRVVYAMSNDGLLFKWMGQVSERFRTPMYGTLFGKSKIETKTKGIC